MNTKHVTDRKERKELKRKARAKRPALQARPSGVARGSQKRKVKQMVRGQRKR
jgi:hypothetical protein